MNLFHRKGVRCTGADERSDFPHAPKKMFANEGAILVPMAVPCLVLFEYMF